MSHHSNRFRKKNTDLVLKIMAKAISKGLAKTKKFKGLPATQIVAYLSLELGATKRKIEEYLEVLLDAGRLEYDGELKVWKLPE